MQNSRMKYSPSAPPSRWHGVLQKVSVTKLSVPYFRPACVYLYIPLLKRKYSTYEQHCSVASSSPSWYFILLICTPRTLFLLISDFLVMRTQCDNSMQLSLFISTVMVNLPFYLIVAGPDTTTGSLHKMHHQNYSPARPPFPLNCSATRCVLQTIKRWQRAPLQIIKISRYFK